MWHTLPLLRIGFPGWIKGGETDGDSVPAASLKASGLARSRAHNRITGAEEISVQSHNVDEVGEHRFTRPNFCFLESRFRAIKPKFPLCPVCEQTAGASHGSMR